VKAAGAVPRAAAIAGLAALALTSTGTMALAQPAIDTVHEAGDAGRRGSDRATWLERVSVSARYGVFRPSGGSEVFALIDRALAPGSNGLRPQLLGGELQVGVTRRWRVLLGAEAGERTIGSLSRVLPVPSSGDVRQQTTLEITSLQYVGAEWQALRWRGASRSAPDRLRLLVGAGAGTARYRLRQWGEFVDADRRIVYADDFRSAGHGGFGYAGAALEVPLRRWLALQADVRRQFGSAPMTADYASFDRLDLGGTRAGVGVTVRPGSGTWR
jgi:hypothetical protein